MFREPLLVLYSCFSHFLCGQVEPCTSCKETVFLYFFQSLFILFHSQLCSCFWLSLVKMLFWWSPDVKSLDSQSRCQVWSFLLGWPLFLSLFCKLSVKVHISRNIHVYFKTKVRTTGFLLNLFNLTPPSLSMRNLILSDSWYDEITYLFYPLILNSFRIIAPIPPSAFVCVYFLLSLD